jgi:sulfur-oxidizing protein SoxA
MRFRSLLLAGVLSATPILAATPDAVRAEMAQRLREAVPQLGTADYAQGAAALDPALAAQVEEHAGDASASLQAGKALWDKRFKDGRSLANCFPNGGRRVAAAYPQWDARVKRVVTLETAINQCLKAHGEPALDVQEPAMARLTAYVRSLSNGQRMGVRVPAAAQDRFEQGRRLYFTRLGQRNYACASCHVVAAGKHFGDETLSPAIGQATHWPVIREGAPVTLQARIRECLELMGAAPFPAGSDELNHLEYFLAYLSNGLPLKANVWRPQPPVRSTAAKP